MDDATFNQVDRETARDHLLENLRRVTERNSIEYIMDSKVYCGEPGKPGIQYADGKAYVGGKWPEGVLKISSWSQLENVHIFDVREALDELMAPQMGFDFAGGVA